MNEVFFERGGRLREEVRQSGLLELWSDKVLDLGKKRENARKHAGKYVVRSLKLAFVMWIIVGFVGCFNRGMNYTSTTRYSGDYDAYARELWSTQLASYTKEAIVAAVVVFALGCIIAILTVLRAEIAYRRVGSMPLN